MQHSVFLIGATASLIAGLASFVGALPVIFLKTITRRVQGILLGFGAGVMLAATSFSLILPAIASSTELYNSEWIAALLVSAGILIGGAFLWIVHQRFPHEHFIKGAEGEQLMQLKRTWLFVAAIALHNFPEGLAVGVGFGNGDVANGMAIAVGIGLQNMPEGLVTAIALLAEGYSKSQSLGVALLTGLIEPLGGLLGAGAVSIAQPILPWGMAFAAGAMLFVISDEIIPESHSRGYENEGTLGVILGFIVMMILDITLA